LEGFNMIVGIPKEIKNNENRVAITPAGVQALVNRGHVVLIEANAGIGSGISDNEYISAGGRIIDTAKDLFASRSSPKLSRTLSHCKV
jgi:alanine dehydrogenase